MDKKTTPAQEIRYGNVRVSIWKNEGASGPFFSAKPERTYRQGDKVRSSSSFGKRDLPSLAKALLDAHTWMYDQG